ncbi:hypothetical protein BDU57DRAFT_455318 [Ampelomyces quisqualis]|uniref:Rrn9 domain-containing protein n=1 Tax=Ampelomyces quisqualis TaxID=50730 RepID=A0A6A5QEU8_AMPQU|nr:hypothetical protein BDU57DRAFT_455318 [Ampelomyces quisqualis]
MSLFGGDSAASRSQSPYENDSEHSPSSSAHSSPSVQGPASPPSAQHLTSLHETAELSHDEEQVLSNSDPDDAGSEEEEPTRPNRFKGGHATWKGYTAADRQVAASLEQLQNNDLAAHLYNAHALKRRVRRPAAELTRLKSWQSNEQWLKKGHELDYEDVSGEIQTNLVPAKDWTAWPLPPARIPRPARQLGGAPASRRDEWTIGTAGVNDVGHELREELLAVCLRHAKERWHGRETADASAREGARATPSPSPSRDTSRSKSVTSARSTNRSASRGDVDMEDDKNKRETQDEDEERSGHIIGKKRGRKAKPVTKVKPMFLADDDKARTILAPSINSVLSKLDDLALAVRRTRLNHFGRKSHGGTSSQSGFTNRSSDLESDSVSDSDVDMVETKQKLPTKKRSRPGSTTSEGSQSSPRDYVWRAGLMDWSEVLGLAAVKGWNERVIARTAQRCATLFGENMTFIPLHEDLATQPIPEPVQYTPSAIPAFDIASAGRPSQPKRPLFRTGTLRCPHVGCYGYNKDFETPHRVVEHCKRVHEYDPRTNDSDNEDRLMGGVHIDGFLQPIASQRGWQERGKSRAKSENKRQKRQEAEDVVTVESD